MWAAGLNPFLELTPNEARWVSPLFKQYSLYIQAKNLEIPFTTNDIDLKTLENLHTIHSAVTDVRDRKNRRRR